MMITRRVLAILAVVVALALSAEPARADRDRFTEVGVEGRVVQLVADKDGTCALTDSGAVYCWGADYSDPYGGNRNLMLLITIGALLLAGGATLLLVSRK